MNSNVWRYATVILCWLTGVLAIASPVVADDAGQVADNRIKLSLASYSIIEAESYFSLSERNLGLGLSINPQDTFGVDLKESVVRLDGSYQFNEEDGVQVSWYKITNSGSNVASKEFTWVDDDGDEITIGAGSETASKLSFEIFDVSYIWTFYNSDKVELLGSMGLHITRVGIELDVINTASGVPPLYSEERVAVTVPLPTLGLGVIYHITPRWRWYLHSELFAFRYDDWRGSYSDVEFLLEYQPTDHFSLGMGVGSNKIKLTEETDKRIFTYDNRLTGFLFQISTMF
ncbi:MAG: hypothetical protein KUG53_01865 [Pseudomonadales bacterium]|nr:hypothetical protein [Pseudomonadales bacterium]